MSGKLNWSRVRFSGKASLDFRWEHDSLERDPAARWLKAAERRQQDRRSHRKLDQREIEQSRPNSTYQSTTWITASSTAEVPW